jgi:7,8-dihydro-6-hydroxymethylpterin dimethyltransferase
METTGITFAAPRERLKTTQTRCPVCHRAIPGEVWREGVRPGVVWMRRTCPEHGAFSARLATDARYYWLALGESENQCCGGGACADPSGRTATLGRNATTPANGKFETLSTCIALIEVVRSCNLACPACYAGSPLSGHEAPDAPALGELQARIEGVIERKGGIEILQLSGGEPTLHPRFLELLAWAQAHPKIDYILINTNGVRFAQDDGFAAGVAALAKARKMQLYLQFDGLESAAQHALRGADLRAVRLRALDRAAAMDLPVTLAMTVTPENVDQCRAVIDFGLGRREIHGVTFQPMFASGRVPAGAEGPVGRLNAADILTASFGAAGGRLGAADFTPLPCGDPNCAIIGYLLRTPVGVRSVAEFVDFGQLQGFLKDKVRYTLEDLTQCGCQTEPLGDLLKQLELRGGSAFRIMVKPFMDAWTWDQDRIDRCCTHVIREDGKLDSFCRHYAPAPVVA